jgi:hypothetical protein
MRPRESSPFWVWLTIGLMTVGGATYVATYFMIEAFLRTSTNEARSQ